MSTVQVKLVNGIPLFHFFWRSASAARAWLPAESTPKFEVWVIIIRPQIFKDKYLQCDFCVKRITFLREAFAGVWAVCVLVEVVWALQGSRRQQWVSDGTKRKGKAKAYVEDEGKCLSHPVTVSTSHSNVFSSASVTQVRKFLYCVARDCFELSWVRLHVTRDWLMFAVLERDCTH